VIGIRSIIESGATIRNSVIMGADYYEDEAFEAFPDTGPRPAIGIGRNSVIDRAIIDKNARIGESVVITPDGKAPNVDSTNYYIRDGVVVIPKNAVIPNGTWI
jgi:glucose-1-phosphate adenylyltransferase